LGEAVVKRKLRILNLEDNQDDFTLVHNKLAVAKIACDLVRVETKDDFVAALDGGEFDLILADYSLPAFDGLSALEIAKKKCPRVPYIFVSGAIGEEFVIETLKRGAIDYVLKDRLALLPAAINRALHEVGEQTKRKRAEKELGEYRKHLEALVQERTTELNRANGLLQRELAERKQAEEALRKSEKHYHSLFDNMLEGFAFCKMLYDDHNRPADFLYLDVNSAFSRLTGLENVVGKKVTAVIPGIKEIHPEIFEIYSRVALTGQPEKLETYFKPLSMWLSISVYSTERECFVTVFDNVTERKRAEESIRVAERKFRNLLEAIRLVAVMLDSHGNITFCNDYLLGLSGWAKSEVLGKNWFDLFIPEEMRDTSKSVFQSIVLETSVPLHYENTLVMRDGSERLVVWDNVSLHDPEGKVIGTASIGTDITGSRRLEEQLRQSQKMEAIGHLAGGIAHDFNNILTAIIGYGSLLKNKVSPEDFLHEYVNQILATAEKAAKLTHSLLAFSRKQVINPKPVNVNDIIVSMQKMLGRIIGEDIRFKVNTVAQDLIVEADRSQLEQAMMNLVTNARDAMPHGGSLTITTEEGEIGELFIRMHKYGELGKYVIVSVSDTGVGMDEKTKEHIFEPFFTTKEAGKGTGLGLAMVYGAIKQHNGFINVYSEPGEGTTFWIYLPVAKSDMLLDDDAAVTAVVPGKETILLVEDDDAVRDVTRVMLEEFGYTVLEASDGGQAVKLFAANRDKVQLVISDIIMPGENGKEVYNALKQIKPDVKALFISGYTADILTQKGIAAEGIDFLSKPLRPGDFSKKIREVLDK
jgi:PAS domain S-box-containing protein